MAEGRIVIGVDLLPCGSVEVAIEAGEHYCALRQTGDRRQEARRRAIRAGRADGDHRPAHTAGFDPCDLPFDGQRAPPRRIDEMVVGQNPRPMCDRYIEEIERDPPIVIEFRKDQRIERRKGDILDDQFVDEIGEIAGKCEGIERRCADETGLARIKVFFAVAVDRDNRMAEIPRPLEDQAGEMHAPPDLARRLRQIFGQRCLETRLFEKQRRLGRIEGAERQNAGQQSRRAIERRSEFVDEAAGGATRRHIDRRVDHAERRKRAREPRDDPAVEQGADKSLEKRCAGCNGKYCARRHRLAPRGLIRPCYRRTTRAGRGRDADLATPWFGCACPFPIGKRPHPLSVHFGLKGSKSFSALTASNAAFGSVRHARAVA